MPVFAKDVEKNIALAASISTIGSVGIILYSILKEGTFLVAGIMLLLSAICTVFSAGWNKSFKFARIMESSFELFAALFFIFGIVFLLAAAVSLV